MKTKTFATLALAVLLAACGSDNDDGQTAPQAPTGPGTNFTPTPNPNFPQPGTNPANTPDQQNQARTNRQATIQDSEPVQRDGGMITYGCEDEFAKIERTRELIKQLTEIDGFTELQAAVEAAQTETTPYRDSFKKCVYYIERGDRRQKRAKLKYDDSLAPLLNRLGNIAYYVSHQESIRSNRDSGYCVVESKSQEEAVKKALRRNQYVSIPTTVQQRKERRRRVKVKTRTYVDMYRTLGDNEGLSPQEVSLIDGFRRANDNGKDLCVPMFRRSWTETFIELAPGDKVYHGTEAERAETAQESTQE